MAVELDKTPPAPAVKSIQGSGQQQGSISSAVADQSQPAGTPKVESVVKPDNPSSQSNLESTQAQTSIQNSSSPVTAPPQLNKPVSFGTKVTAPSSSTATYDKKNDPRDKSYWANVTALQATYGGQMALLQAEEDRANVQFNQDTTLQNEYQRRRKRDLAESRLGTGSSYTGSARRQQGENDFEFAVNEGRRRQDKFNADQQRNNERFNLGAQLSNQEADLFRQYTDRFVKGIADESQTSAGDATFVAEKPDYSKRIASTTKRIQTLRERMKKADNPRQKARIQDKIERLRKRRSTLQGKAGKK